MTQDKWLFVGTGIFLSIAGAMVLVVLLLLMMMLNPAVGKELVVASSYGDPQDIRRTGERKVATGKPLDPNGNTVAHRTLPFGTHLTLTHGHRKMEVTVVDRGPFVRGRTLDLTPAANKYLRCGGLCRLKMEPWPPLPKPKPYVETAIIWGEENESGREDR